MRIRAGPVVIVLVLCLAAAGCLSPQPGQQPAATPSPEPTPVPTPSPAPESEISTVPLSDLALVPEDLPADYILRDRYVVAWQEVDSLLLDIGWRQGYAVTYYRLDKARDDRTDIRQVIGIYPPESMNRVFVLEKEEIKSMPGMGETIYEVPFPKTGDDSIAFRQITPGSSGSTITYTVIFRQKNVYEMITMSGTTTDYELLKEIAAAAISKIR